MEYIEPLNPGDEYTDDYIESERTRVNRERAISPSETHAPHWSECEHNRDASLWRPIGPYIDDADTAFDCYRCDTCNAVKKALPVSDAEPVV